MTLGKTLFYALLLAVLCSCNSDEAQLIGDEGFILTFRNCLTEQVGVIMNRADGDVCDGITVTVSSKPMASGNTVSYLYGKADHDMEQQLETWIDPDGKMRHGMIPVAIDYTTAVCEDIKLTLYDQNGVMLSDITNQARFHFPYDDVEAKIFLFNAEKTLLGTVAEGCTIQEYLANHPMLFAKAQFVFPEQPDDMLQDGNYVTAEVKLANGVILSSQVDRGWE